MPWPARLALLLSFVLIAPTALAAPVAAANTAVAAPFAPGAAAVRNPGVPPPVVESPQATLARLAAQAPLISNDDQLAQMEARAAAIEAQARATLAGPAAEVAQIDAELARPPPRRRPLTAAEKATRASLAAQRAQLQATMAGAASLAQSAEQTYEVIAERRRAGFSARVLTRSVSPLSPDFWTSLVGAAGGDVDRLAVAADDAIATAVQAPEPQGLASLAAALAVAAALVFPVRWWLDRLGRRKSGEAVHPGFGRTGAALWVAAVDAGLPTLAMAALKVGAEWGGLLSRSADAMAAAAVGATAWAAGIVALGRVLATEADASQRLLPLPDDVARRTRLPLVVVALVTGAGFLTTRLNYVIGASVSATVAANCAISIAYAAVAAVILVSFGRSRSAAQEGGAAARSPLWTLISLVLTLAIVVTLGAVLSGYSTLAAVTSGQIFWLSLLGAAAYLVMRYVDDLCAAVFSQRGWASRTLYVIFSFRRATIAQAGALISAALQLVVLIATVSLALTPFGRGGDLLAADLGQLGAPIKLGSVTISPPALAAGLATFIVGMGIARAVQGWVVRRYLPVTDWDSGVRNSVTTGVGYLGVGIAIMCALAASGLGFTQIALVASALSVGIGFGLQNVVQNFVAGVILLVERPVKVGDWVNIDGLEGDVRRIRVRATEIQTFDRAMVIVPNSDFITKSVQNKTLGERVARVQLKLSITKAEEVSKARELILSVAAGLPEVVKDPAPAVFIESLGAGGAVNLTCNFFVGDPRHVYRTRSACYFALLEQLQHFSIAFAGVVE